MKLPRTKSQRTISTALGASNDGAVAAVCATSILSHHLRTICLTVQSSRLVNNGNYNSIKILRSKYFATHALETNEALAMTEVKSGKIEKRKTEKSKKENVVRKNIVTKEWLAQHATLYESVQHCRQTTQVVGHHGCVDMCSGRQGARIAAHNIDIPLNDFIRLTYANTRNYSTHI